MGLLDDAIRDHLELKRRHGADPSEVSKLEHEAFGPIQRRDALEVGSPPEPGTGLDEAEHALAEEEELAYEETELEAEEEWELEHPPAAPAAPAEPAFVDEPLPVDETGAVRVEWDDLPEEEAVAGSETGFAPAPGAEPAPAHEAGPPAPAAATPEAGEHDELEETPEFLEETPEHDRLWFEQKPPRDFDF